MGDGNKGFVDGSLDFDGCWSGRGGDAVEAVGRRPIGFSIPY